MDTNSPNELASDFRYALEVMEESDHLGLDDEHTCRLREILQHRIEGASAAFSVKAAQPVLLPMDEESVA